MPPSFLCLVVGLEVPLDTQLIVLVIKRSPTLEIDEDLKLPAIGVKTDLLDESGGLNLQRLGKQIRLCEHALF